MNSYIYDKTDKGREEIATRKYQVPNKLRTLLVMIDGRHPLEALKRNFAPLGLNEDSITLLLKEEYITLIGGEAEPVAAPKRPPADPASIARAKMAERSRLAAARLAAAPTEEPDEFDLDDLVEQERTVLPAPAVGGAPASAAAAPGGQQMSDSERFQAVHEFYNQTIKSLLGFRGFTLQMKVEKAGNLAELRALRLPYLQAVYKSKGSEMALSLRERLDKLLGGPPAVDDFSID
jgi:hypothetical protein